MKRVKRYVRPVLVVDDDLTARRLVVSALEEAGITCREAESGPAALEILEDISVDAVIVDHQMPGMTGIELTQKIRAMPRQRLTPVLFVSADDGAATLVSALKAGATDFILKPVLAEELSARVGAQIRLGSEWQSALAGFEHRAATVAELGAMSPLLNPVVAARTICERISAAHGGTAVAIYSCAGPSGRASSLASTTGGIHLEDDPTVILSARGDAGPWVHRPGPGTPGGDEPSWLACAPLRSASTLVGILAIADNGEPEEALLAAAIDYAVTTSLHLGRALADTHRAGQHRRAVEEILDGRAFKPVFQPVVDLEDGSVIGYEALTRLDGGQSVIELLADAEQADMRPQCELTLLSVALASCEQIGAEAWLSVNLSPSVLVQHHEQLADIFSSCQSDVVIELTENERIDDYPAVLEAFGRLRSGTKLSVDDMGSGYASLRHVIDLRPHYLKLDRSWITGLEGDRMRQALVAGMVAFCEQSGAQLIAEGIETEAERDTLHRLGVGYGQGYLLGRPGPLPERAEQQPCSTGAPTRAAAIASHHARPR